MRYCVALCSSKPRHGMRLMAFSRYVFPVGSLVPLNAPETLFTALPHTPFARYDAVEIMNR